MSKQKFNYKSKESLLDLAKELNLDLGLSQNVSALGKKLDLGDGFDSPNSLAIHPLEGCDSQKDGAPTDLSLRRYLRFAKGGAGLIWFEAISVNMEGRGNPHQFQLNEENLDSFNSLISEMRAKREEVSNERQILIGQLTHSGRYAKPQGIATPLCAYDNLGLRLNSGHDEKIHVYLSDDQLDSLQEDFVKTALLCKEAGFDGVDVKACHGYLLGELLSAYERPGKYGGSFENRTRMMVETFKKVKEAVGDNFIVCARLNLFDSYAKTETNPGWGGDIDNINLEEPIKLIGILKDLGLKLINITMGNPYYNPHINRPYNTGAYEPEEHPLVGIDRLFKGAQKVKEAHKDLVVVGTGYSWFRSFAPSIGAYHKENNIADMMGMGRAAMAYPDFANDILEKGQMFKEKSCLTCSLCTKIMRAGKIAGCPVRDQEVYLPILKEVRRNEK